MNRVALVIPYFGKFNNYFELWLRSAENNQTVDFIILTDNHQNRRCSDNILWEIVTFDEIKKKIQDIVDFPISLESPYKLCEYKMAYGHIFEELLVGYEFWGFCDVDLIFGDFRSFINDEALDTYDKFYFRGHLSIYRNNSFFRQLYNSHDKRLPVTYDMAWKTKYICHFDELLEWNDIICNEGFRVYENVDYADLRVDKWSFYEAFKDKKNMNKIFLKDERKVYCVSTNGIEIYKNEILYVHLQKRKMKVPCNLKTEKYYIVPNDFVNLDSISVDIIMTYSKDRIWLNYYYRRVKEIVTNVRNGALIMRYKTAKRRAESFEGAER